VLIVNVVAATGTEGDRLKSESGNYLLWGDVADDTLKGGRGNDTGDFSDDTAGVTTKEDRQG